MPLRVSVGTPPLDVQGRQKEFVSLLLGPSDRALPYLVKHLTAVNGDCRKTDILEHYWIPRWGPNSLCQQHQVHDEQCASLHTDWEQAPPVTKAWMTGFHEVVADACMLAAVHGLLRPTYQCFVLVMQKVPQTIAVDEAPGSTEHEGP